MKDGGGFNEFFRVCTTDLCNDWDGILSRQPGGSGDGDGGGATAVVLGAVGLVIALMVQAIISG